MANTIPSPDQVRIALSGLSPTQLRALGEKSGVSIHTLAKIQTGETPDPRLGTAHKLSGHIRIKAIKPTAPAEA